MKATPATKVLEPTMSTESDLDHLDQLRTDVAEFEGPLAGNNGNNIACYNNRTTVVVDDAAAKQQVTSGDVGGHWPLATQTKCQDKPKNGPMRSHFESLPSCLECQRTKAGKLPGCNGDVSSGSYEWSHADDLVESLAFKPATVTARAPTTKTTSQLEVQWKDSSGSSRGFSAGSLRSLCIKTSLVRTIKSKRLVSAAGRDIATASSPSRCVGHTIKGLLVGNLGFVGGCKKVENGLLPCHRRHHPRCPLSPAKFTSLSCQSVLNPISSTTENDQHRRSHHQVGEEEEGEDDDEDDHGDMNEYMNAKDKLETNRDSEARSSNIMMQPTTMGQTLSSAVTLDDSSDVSAGCLMRHKCTTTTMESAGSSRTTGRHLTRCSGCRRENRRSTYCSSTGAGTTTDMNCDSSFSSAINCSESNITCAMNRICSRDGLDKQRTQSSENCKLTALGSSGGGAHQTRRDGRLSLSSSLSTTAADHHHGRSDELATNNLKARENWKNIQFLLAVIGFAVDLGNVWRFPYICYKNGGGAFLIPYTIMFILGGLPIFYLEMSLGQYFSSGCLTVWRRVCPMAKGIGYAMCVLNFFTGLYYNTIISWAVFFFVESFTTSLPWTSCSNDWNSDDCRTIEQRQSLKFLTNQTLTTQLPIDSTSHPPLLEVVNETHYSSPTKDYFEREVLKVHLSTGIDDLGSVRKPLAIYLAIVFVCIYFAIWKGVKSTGKAVWITALLPYFVLIPLLIRGVFLEGAWLGIRYYLYPEWSKILDIDVWVEAAKQIYFSLGPGFGTLMALSSYNKFNHNCRKDALIAATVNYFASFISGLVIFAVLGYMATMEKVSINDVATEGPGLVFQVYPEGLATMRFSSIWSVLFFIMVITLGIDSTFGGLESVITGLCDEYPRLLRAHRGIFIGFLIILIYLCSLPTTTYGGNYVIYVLESYGTSLSLLFIVLIETIIVCWLYGAERFCGNLEEMYGQRPGPYWRICWKYISPTILLIIFLAACGQELDKYHTLSNGEYTYPTWAPTLGLLMTGSSVCCIPIYALYHLKVNTSGTFYERIKSACKPEGDNKVENEIYISTSTDKIREEHRFQLDTVI